MPIRANTPIALVGTLTGFKQAPSAPPPGPSSALRDARPQALASRNSPTANSQSVGVSRDDGTSQERTTAQVTRLLGHASPTTNNRWLTTPNSQHFKQLQALSVEEGSHIERQFESLFCDSTVDEAPSQRVLNAMEAWLSIQQVRLQDPAPRSIGEGLRPWQRLLRRSHDEPRGIHRQEPPADRAEYALAINSFLRILDVESGIDPNLRDKMAQCLQPCCEQAKTVPPEIVQDIEKYGAASLAAANYRVNPETDRFEAQPHPGLMPVFMPGEEKATFIAIAQPAAAPGAAAQPK